MVRGRQTAWIGLETVIPTRPIKSVPNDASPKHGNDLPRSDPTVEVMSEQPRSPRRGRKPSWSRRRFLCTATTLVGGTPGCLDARVETPDTDEESPSPTETTVDEQVGTHERAIHERVNEARQSHDLDPLAHDEAIAAVARRHSTDMAERGYFAHTSPEGEQPADRLAEFFPEPCRMIGENIARVGLRPDDDPEEAAERVVSGWMDSQGHRENILNASFDAEGIGVAVTESDRLFATQNFCATNGSSG